MTKKLGIIVSVFILTWGCSNITEEDLQGLLSHNEIAKRKAIEAVSREGSPPCPLIYGDRAAQAVRLLVQMLQGGKESPQTTAAILEALGNLGKCTEIPTSLVVETLEHPDVAVRLAAIEMLGKVKDKSAMGRLASLLKKASGDERYAIIWAIGEMRDEKAVPTLNKLLDDRDPYVRYNAQRALGEVGTTTISPEPNGSANFELKDLIHYGRTAFQKYLDAMTLIFKKMAGAKNRT